MFNWINGLIVAFSVLSIESAVADSAAAWKAYQEGRDPLMEVGLLLVGVVFFFGLLVAMNKTIESRKRQKKPRSKSN